MLFLVWLLGLSTLRGTHIVACSSQSVIDTVRALYVAWTHTVGLPFLPTTDVRAAASFSARSNSKADHSCVSLWVIHTLGGGITGVCGTDVRFPGGSVVKNLSACQCRKYRYPGEGNGNPLLYSCLENPMDRVIWQATVHGVIESQTPLSD